MGGASAERDVSLATGRGVAAALKARGHELLALDPSTGERLSLDVTSTIGSAPPESGGTGSASSESDRTGSTPPANAAPGQASSALDAADRVPDAGAELPSAHAVAIPLAGHDDLDGCDVVFIALHGGAGEDGTLQALLDLSGVPYTGSGMLASALAMDKTRSKVMMKALGVPSPRGRLLLDVTDEFDPNNVGGFPLVVKPNREGSSVGVHIVEEEAAFPEALADAFRYGPVMVETFIPGRELTVAVLGGKALPVVEIFPEGGVYDYQRKYTHGETRYEVPADLPPDMSTELARLGEKAYQALGCEGVARVDFRLDEQGQAFCLEVNTIPGMTATSLVPMAAKAGGMDYEELVERLLELAVSRKS